MFSEAYMHGLAHHLMTVSTSDGVGFRDAAFRFHEYIIFPSPFGVFTRY